MKQRFYKYGIFIVFILLLVLIPIIKLHFDGTSNAIAINGALQESKQIANSLKAFRYLYSSKVIDEVSHFTDLKVVHDYYDQQYDTLGGAIPLPITLSLELAKRMSSDKVSVDLYSKYPFPWRKGRELSTFQEDAWVYFQDNPLTDESFYRINEITNELYYSISDKMVHETCVSCHNSHPDTPKNDWKLGDVRGVISIVQPVHDEAIIKAANQKTYILLGTIFLFCLLIIILIIGNNKIVSAKIIKGKIKLEHAVRVLKESEEKYRILTENSLIGIFKTNITGKILYFNDALLYLLESDPSYRNEIYEQGRLIQYQNPEEQENILKLLQKDGKAENLEIQVITLKNNVKTFLFTATLAGNQIYGGLMDISELKIAQKELLMSNKKLSDTLNDLKQIQTNLVRSEKMASIGQLTAGIAHELNNPINFISAGTIGLERDVKELIELLEKYERLDSDVDKNTTLKEIQLFKDKVDYKFLKENLILGINDIQTGARRSAEIVQGLRKFSRLDVMKKGPTDLHQCVDDTLAILHTTLKNKIEIVKKYDNKVKKIFGYPGQLNQMFMNIIMNAEEAIIERGTIIISTKNENNGVTIIISDDGCGISDEVITRVFDPFFSTKEVGAGTGLGLSISYGIIQMHQGKIELESKVGKGTDIIIYFPYL